jgi:hypothetical protein
MYRQAYRAGANHHEAFRDCPGKTWCEFSPPRYHVKQTVQVSMYGMRNVVSRTYPQLLRNRIDWSHDHGRQLASVTGGHGLSWLASWARRRCQCRYPSPCTLCRPGSSAALRSQPSCSAGRAWMTQIRAIPATGPDWHHASDHWHDPS